MKLYALLDGPPSIAVRMVLKALDLPYDLIGMDYSRGEHLREIYSKVKNGLINFQEQQLNPQREVPALDDDGFVIGESVAIMQYLCDQYAPENPIYPQDPKERALVNHRMCFNMNYYYANISPYALAPIWFDFPRNNVGKLKVDRALSVFGTYLESNSTKYVAGDEITIADVALVSSTIALEATEIDFSDYPLVTTWYETFKSENPELWEIGQESLDAIAEVYQSPPDVSEMNHPINPTRRD